MNTKMYVKAGVTLKELKPIIRKTLNVVQWHFNKAKIKYLFVNSTCDGNHGFGSFHYGNEAIDIDTVDIKDITDDILDDIRNDLGKDFDVVDESDHIHIEYDPK